MTPDPKTGLVAVLDLGPTENVKGSRDPLPVSMFPVDWAETSRARHILKDGTPRFVLKESYVPPDPA